MTSLSRARRGPATTGWLVFAAVLCIVPACDFSILDDDEATTARVELDGDDEEAALRVVTSMDFTPSRTGGKPALVSADTTEVNIPFEETYSLGPNSRIFVEAGSADSSAVTISMRVWIGSRQEFDVSRTLTDETLRFVYLSQDLSS